MTFAELILTADFTVYLVVDFTNNEFEDKHYMYGPENRNSSKACSKLLSRQTNRENPNETRNGNEAAFLSFFNEEKIHSAFTPRT